MTLSVGSVCSGIEAVSAALLPLGYRAAWFAEIAPFPCAVLAHHHPDVPNYGDLTTLPARILAGEIEAPDFLFGGTPCQAYSLAGARQGMADPRGALTMSYVHTLDAIDVKRPPGQEAVAVWENVPGVLSDTNNAFGCFLAALCGEDEPIEPDKKPKQGKGSQWWRWDKKHSVHVPRWPVAGCVAGPRRSVAWRVLDAQFFGVPQCRRRVFLVASARPGFNPAQVLFEFSGVRGNPGAGYPP